MMRKFWSYNFITILIRSNLNNRQERCQSEWLWPLNFAVFSPFNTTILLLIILVSVMAFGFKRGYEKFSGRKCRYDVKVVVNTVICRYWKGFPCTKVCVHLLLTIQQYVDLLMSKMKLNNKKYKKIDVQD